MDRIDIFIEVPAVTYEKLTEQSTENQTHAIKSNIEKARHIQKNRFANDHILVNAEMQIPQIKKYCATDEKSQELLKKYVDSSKLSARGYHRILKVARTIADLAGAEHLHYAHVAEALMYRLKS